MKNKNLRGFTTAVVMRKNKAKGGRVYKEHEHHDSPTGPTNYKNRNKSSDMDHGSRKGPEGYSKYQEQAQNQKGVHTPVSGVTGFPGGKSTSEAGDMSTQTWKGKPHRELRDHGKELHKKKLKEMQDMPAPKLKGLAEGGRVSVSPIKRPKMVPSDAFSARLRDEEDDLMMSEHPASPMEQPPEHDNELEATEEGPDVEALHMKRMAEGGDIEDELSVGATASSPASRLDRGYGKVIMKAMGGEISPEDEIQDEDDSSIAAAIMAKRKRMAAGGEVDLSQNADEEPNHEDQMSFEALKKENYSESEGLDALDQPEDSNLHHVALDSDEHDMISAIRRKMKQRR